MTSNCFKKRERVIAETAVKMTNVDTICINTRGSEITKYIKNMQGEKKLAGTAYEDIEESYYDILGIVEYALNLGYTSIYLQGHSLGATKVVFSYMKMIEEDVKEVLNIIKEHFTVDWYKRNPILSKIIMSITGYYFKKYESRDVAKQKAEQIVTLLSQMVEDFITAMERGE